MRQDSRNIFKVYFPLDDTQVMNDIVPLTVWSFVTIYALLLVSDGYYFLVFLLLGFGIGGLYWSRNIESRLEPLLERQLSMPTEEQVSPVQEAKQLKLFYSPLTVVSNQLLDYVMRDFVSSWWTPLNEHHDPTFEILARERLSTIILTVEKILLNQERNDIVMSTLYGVANTLIIHMRECRAFEDSQVSIDDFVIKNPQSPFAQLLSKEEQHRQLLGLSQTFLKKTLPSSDRDSVLLLSLFKELLANFVFGRVLDSFSDPDFLNCWIVSLLSPEEEKNKEGESVDNTKKNMDEDDQDLSVLGVVQKATKDVMDTTNNNKKPVIEQVTPPDTPEPQRKVMNNNSGLYAPVTENEEEQAVMVEKRRSTAPTMIFTPNSVSFVIMDISPPPMQSQSINKSELIYIIQIERPATEEHAGSEGGGYVITRSYVDFENFHTVIQARHTRRITRLSLKLPLDNTNNSRSWLKTASNNNNNNTRRLEMVSQGLEKYIETVVHDPELGTDPIILAFLRKERRSGVGSTGGMMSFSEEYRDTIVASYHFLAENSNNNKNNSTARSLFSRNSTASNNTVREDNDTESLDGSSGKKWFSTAAAAATTTIGIATKAKREGSISSIHSSRTLTEEPQSTLVDEECDQKRPYVNLNTTLEPRTSSSSLHSDESIATIHSEPIQDKPSSTTASFNKTLSPMDVELLIETTYALVVEIFNLTSSNNKAWMRRSILNLLREIVRRSYAEFIAEQYTDFVNEYMSPDAIVYLLNQLGEQLWPEGKWMLEGTQPAERTEADKEQSRREARELLMAQMIPNAVRQLIGDQNCNIAMDRIWARLQDTRLNRVLMLQVMERIIKPILG
ncbi:hypothetical protein K501DRAFT_331455 [Backusella circina FSU 941]|nr:hypothetical protein K501DRAFT_331455 [Backusella circina FSU 941]